MTASHSPGRIVLVTAAVLAVLFSATSMGELRTNFLDRRPENDFRAYREAALAAAEGKHLYRFHREGDAHLRTTPYPYPPFLASLLVPLSQLPVWPAYYLWCALLVCALAVSLVLVDRAIRPTGRQHTDLVLAAALVLGLFLLDSNFYWGQVNLLLLPLIAGAVLAGLRGRPATAGGLIAIATALKLLPVLLLGWFVIRRDLRALGGFVAALFVALLVVPSLAGGPGWAWRMNVEWSAILWAALTEGKEGMLKYYNGLPNGSLQAVMDRFFHALKRHTSIPEQGTVDSLVTTIRLTIAFGSAAALVCVARPRSTREDRPLWIISVALLLVCGWLINYLLWDHHLIGLLVALPLVTAVAVDPSLSWRWRRPLFVGLTAGVAALSCGFFPGARRWGLPYFCLLALWAVLARGLITADRIAGASAADPRQVTLPFPRT